MPKAVIDSLDQVAEPLRGEYEARDGKFHLKIEGTPHGFAPAAELAAANGKIVELRDNNIAIVKTVKDVLGVDAAGDITKFEPALKAKFDGVNPDEFREMKTKFAGVDPAEYRTLKTQADELKNKGITKPDDIAAQIKQHIEAALAPVTTELTSVKTQLATSETARAQAQKELARKSFETQLVTVGTKLGVDEKMMAPFINHAFGVWQPDGDTFIAKNGAAPIFSKTSPASPVGVEEWIGDQLTVVPGFFKQSGGGGAQSAAAQNAPRPGVTRLVNPTPQQLGSRDVQEGLRKGTVEIVNQ